METSVISILPIFSIIFVLGIWGIGIYTLVLLIKALKIYIKKNS
ncbi:hypothetical protein [uncultured Clostridium sp.]|nr:hypothetical protein [uncultured Clostridium sp.]